MTNSAVYVNTASEIVPLPFTYKNANGQLTDPGAITLALTDPHGTATSYTYATGAQDPNHLIKDAVGKYHINFSLFGGSAPDGLWSWMCAGTGGSVANGAQIDTGSFRVLPLTGPAGMQSFYVSMEDLKSRLSIDPADTSDDYEIQLAIQGVTGWITDYCKQHFYRVTETRTFEPDSLFDLKIDPLVSATSVKLDYDGDGVYEVTWTEGTDFQLLRYPKDYNPADAGVARPVNYLQVIGSGSGSPGGGQWLPWLVPFTRRDRVQITGTWGWADIPPNVTQAALILSADLFKSKDAPWGVAGISDLGMVRVQTNPWIVDLLRGYINDRKKVGV